MAFKTDENYMYDAPLSLPAINIRRTCRKWENVTALQTERIKPWWLSFLFSLLSVLLLLLLLLTVCIPRGRFCDGQDRFSLFFFFWLVGRQIQSKSSSCLSLVSPPPVARPDFILRGYCIELRFLLLFVLLDILCAHISLFIPSRILMSFICIYIQYREGRRVRELLLSAESKWCGCFWNI